MLTNNHVIEDATSITATVAGKTYPARVVGYDKTDDIAVIQLQGAARLPTVPVGNSSLSSGVLVRGVICGSPAARAGMTAGAVITAVSGQPVRSPDDLMRVMARFRPGDTIFVGWTNPAGKHATSRIRLTEGPPQ